MKKHKKQRKYIQVLGNEYDLLVQYKNIKTPSLSFKEQKIEVLLPNKFKKMENTEIVNILMNKMYEKIAEKESQNA